MMSEKEQIKAFIEQELLVNKDIEVNFNDDLLLSGLVNSLGVIRLVAFSKETFGVEIPADEIIIENFETIDAIANYIQTIKA